MNIIIVGAGTVGRSLAEHFSQFNHQLAIIEQDESTCSYLKGNLDILVVHDKGSSPAALETAGIQSADMLIAVTSDDEANLLACNFAMQHGVKTRIARIQSETYTEHAGSISLEKLGVTNVIEPEKEVVEKILQYVRLPDVIETANFQSNNIYLRGYQITDDMPIAHKSLLEIRHMAETVPILIVAIVRAGKNLSPRGDRVLVPHDKIVAIMSKDALPTFRQMINRKETKQNKIIVSGDSLTAIHLTETLIPLSNQVVLVDPDAQHGHLAASMLEGVEVLHGDCTDPNLLREIHADHADYFIAAGKDMEDNVMSCFLAKEGGARKTIALRNDSRHSKLFRALGIDHIVNPQDITSNLIIEKIQPVPIGTYLKLKTADIEILRLKANTNSPITHKPLKELSKLFKESIIVGAIIRDQEVIIPSGDTHIIDNDEVIMLCSKEHLDWVYQYFRPSFAARLASKLTK